MKCILKCLIMNLNLLIIDHCFIHCKTMILINNNYYYIIKSIIILEKKNKVGYRNKYVIIIIYN